MRVTIIIYRNNLLLFYGKVLTCFEMWIPEIHSYVLCFQATFKISKLNYYIILSSCHNYVVWIREFYSFTCCHVEPHIVDMQLFTILLVTLFNRDKHLAERYITYVVIIMFILPFGAVAPNLLVADRLKRAKINIKYIKSVPSFYM